MDVPRHFSRGGEQHFLSKYIDLFLEAYFLLGILPITVEITLLQGEASAQSCPPLGTPMIKSKTKLYQ